MCRQSEKLLGINISFRCPHNMVNFGPLTVEIGSGVGAPQQISTGFASWHRCCTDVAQRRSTKHCMTFGCLLGWYTIYKFSGLLLTDGILPGAKFTLRPKSCVLLWQRYCRALEQSASTKICGMLQGMELRNFRRGRQFSTPYRINSTPLN